jgi:hypothetical protein
MLKLKNNYTHSYSISSRLKVNSFIFDLITFKGDVTISCEIVALWEFFLTDWRAMIRSVIKVVFLFLAHDLGYIFPFPYTI